MKFKTLIAITIAAAILNAAGNNAETRDGSRLAPRLLNYQGYLTDTLSNPITNPSVPMTFVENRGQWPDTVKFGAHGGALFAGFEKHGIHLRLFEGAARGKTRAAAVRLTFEGASEAAARDPTIATVRTP